MKNPIEMLANWAAESNPQHKKTYLRQELKGEWKEYSYREVYLKVKEMAAALSAAGLKGQNVAILSRNCAEWVIADFAILMSGAISVPILPGYSLDNLGKLIERAQLKAIFCGKLDNWSQIQKVIPSSVTLISFEDFKCEGCLSWNSFLTSNPNLNFTAPHREESELATITFTSGSTGTPKGVMHSLGAMSFVGAHIQKVIQLTNSDHLISYLPMAHVAERALSEFGVLYAGGTLSFIEGQETFVKNCQEIQPQVFLAVPRIWQKFQEAILKKMPQEKLNKLLSIPLLSTYIKHKLKKNLGIAGARRIASGAAPLPQPLFQWFKKMGILIRDGYGLTETFSYAHFALQEKVKAGSVGQALEGVVSRISESGELEIKSPSNMLGFYNDELQTKEAFTDDGFFKSGDKGVIDEDGFLFIVGRLKENFKTTKGKYIVPSQLESKISSFSLVDQCCVMGTNREAPYAIVSLSEEAKAKPRDHVEEAFQAFLLKMNTDLENHEKIAKILLTEAIWTAETNFLTPTLKIKRNILESFYEDEINKNSSSPKKVLYI